MSDQVHSSSTPKTINECQLNREAALRIATIIAEANERLFKVQSETANAAFAENSKHLKALLDPLNVKSSEALIAEWTKLYQANMRRALDVTRSCFEIIPKTQGEIAKLLGEPFACANEETQKHFDQITKAIGDGRDAATNTVDYFLTHGIAAATGNTRRIENRLLK